MRESNAKKAENGASGYGRVDGVKKTTYLCALVLSISMSQAMADASEQKAIASFDVPTAADNWSSVNDGVMGGVSKGAFEITADSTLLFSGNLSLENNGGFASIRTKPRALDLAGLTGVKVVARGDGRSYWVELRGPRQMGASSYRAYLTAPEGAWVTTVIPLADFKFQSYGRQLPAPAIDPSTIRSVGFMLADKKEGPFRLEIESVKAIFEDARAQSGGSIVDVASAAGNFQTLLAAAAATPLAEMLATDGPFTVFAPTDEAFAQLPAGTLERLLKPENELLLYNILKYHVVAGRVSLAQILEEKQATTLQGKTLASAFEDGRVRIGPSTLIKADIEAANGLIHVIDQVQMPPEGTRSPLTPAALIELAIDRGVPLFNDGNPRGCAAVYEITCQALLVIPSVCADSIADLERALGEIRTETSDPKRAWHLRHALDRVYTRLSRDS